MQQLVVQTSQFHFLREVNELLMDGWRVVPGTLCAYSVESPAHAKTHPADVLPNGRALRTVFMATVENEEVH